MPETEQNETLLLVDDNPTNLQVLFQTLQGEGHKLLIAKNGEDALGIAGKARPSLILLDVMMPGIDGYETCRRLKASPDTADSSVIFLSALDDAASKVRGLEAGAVDFVSKPFQAEEVIARVRTHLTIHVLQRRLQRQKSDLERELRVAQELLKEAKERVDGPLLGESPAVRGLREAVEKYASNSEPLLLVGPPGAGQEAVARAIHHQSPRREMAFIYVNCAAQQTSTRSHLLFDRSADAGNQRASKFNLAAGGTIFLDGLQDLPPESQKQLLSALSNTSEEGGPDARVIAAARPDSRSQADLTELDKKINRLLGRNRLSVPGLEERHEDVPTLARFFLRQHSRRLGKVLEGISAESLEKLEAYSWPGNIRELSNLLERAVLASDGPQLRVDDSMLDEGVRLGSYRLIDMLKSGGMGEVWTATHQMLSRPAAVKLIRSDTSGMHQLETLKKRFEREAQVTAGLTSPNTVQLFDFGVSETGSFYLVMELLKGMDLDSMVTDFGVLSTGRAVFFLKQACRSLEEAHRAGLIHRDIKPANLFACRLGAEYDFLKVLDFGVVKPVAEEQDSQLTVAGNITGTPSYMAPEMVLEGSGDARSDLYALGCVGHWMMSGRPVFEGQNTVQILMHHARTQPDPLSRVSELEIPPRVEEIVLACLEKDPEKRPQSAAELWRHLDEIELDQPWTASDAEKWWRVHLPQHVAES